MNKNHNQETYDTIQSILNRMHELASEYNRSSIEKGKNEGTIVRVNGKEFKLGCDLSPKKTNRIVINQITLF